MPKTISKSENWVEVGGIRTPDTQHRVVLTPAMRHLRGKSLDGFNVYINSLGEIKLVPIIRVPIYEADLSKKIRNNIAHGVSFYPSVKRLKSK